MTPDDRRKALATAAAQLAGNPLVPVALRVAVAALAEEIDFLRGQAIELRARLREAGIK